MASGKTMTPLLEYMKKKREEKKLLLKEVGFYDKTKS